MSVDKLFFGNTWRLSGFGLNMEKSHCQGMGIDGLEEFSKVVSDDIVDGLPVDPFGMDVKSAVTAIWLDNSDEDCFGFNFSKIWDDRAKEEEEEQQEGEEEEEKLGDDGLFLGPDWFLDGALMWQPQKGNMNVGSISVQDCNFNGFGVDSVMDAGSLGSNRGCWDVCDPGKELQGEGGDPHDAMFYALGYLEVKDLLVVERVCKSFYDAVSGDSLLWRSIHIDQPLNDKITDEALVTLTNRAQGSLECLSLEGCFKITDDGLKKVLHNNPRLMKLCVPGCVRLSIDGILSTLKALKSAGNLRIKYLRIGGLFGATESQFEELKSLLDVHTQMQARKSKPHFYRVGEIYLSCDDDRAIDIEMCPKCQMPRLVYDCPAATCQENCQDTQLCRACNICITRCIGCGCCINDYNYEETFYLDLLCLDCLKRLLNCQEKSEVRHASSSGHTIFHQEWRYQLCLYGE